MKLIRNSIFNLLGLGLPLIAAAFSIPVLIEQLGVPRFGLLTIVWAVVSYFGLFDLGLGRALTQKLAISLANKNLNDVGPLVGTASALMLVLGVLAALLMAALAPLAVDQIREVPDPTEATRAFYALALAMPAVLLTAGFRGSLEAQHAFGIINLIRIPMGIFTFLSPVIVVMASSPRLDYVALVLAIGRIIACFIHWIFMRRTLELGSSRIRFDKNFVLPLCASGGWLTISNIVSPLMSYVDRFLIASLVSATAVAYYVTPHELITKLWIIPGALTAVLFPTFATQVANRSETAAILYKKVIYWLYAILLPLTLLVIFFSERLLSLWINSDFAARSAPLLQIFSIGMFATCLASIPFTLIQSSGNARTTAIIHTVELPFFIVILWVLTERFGVAGAACAWLARVVIDAAVMFYYAQPLVPFSPGKRSFLGQLIIASTIAACLFLVTVYSSD